MSELVSYRVRTSVLFAAKAPRAVILRRGPKTHYRLILWNTDDDTFEPGQWMKGNVMLCDLSPSGQRLIYFAEQYHRHSVARTSRSPYDPLASHVVRDPKWLVRRGRKVPRYVRRAFDYPHGSPPRAERGSWTAVSTPPYFSALAIWPSIGRRTGGGVFKAEREIALNEPAGGMTPITNSAAPQSVRVISAARPYPTSAYRPSAQEGKQHVSIANALRQSGVEWVDWISLRDEPDLLFAGDGRICRLRNFSSVAPGKYLELGELLVDLRHMAFERIAAPDGAMAW